MYAKEEALKRANKLFEGFSSKLFSSPESREYVRQVMIGDVFSQELDRAYTAGQRDDRKTVIERLERWFQNETDPIEDVIDELKQSLSEKEEKRDR